jgi:hypothetical protein
LGPFSSAAGAFVSMVPKVYVGKPAVGAWGSRQCGLFAASTSVSDPAAHRPFVRMLAGKIAVVYTLELANIIRWSRLWALAIAGTFKAIFPRDFFRICTPSNPAPASPASKAQAGRIPQGALAATAMLFKTKKRAGQAQVGALRRYKFCGLAEAPAGRRARPGTTPADTPTPEEAFIRVSQVGTFTLD